jgi:hypothetical protein
MPDDFFTRNLSAAAESEAETTRTMSILLGAIASISLLVGGIGIDHPTAALLTRPVPGQPQRITQRPERKSHRHLPQRQGATHRQNGQ